jgi:hypothetical protein
MGVEAPHPTLSRKRERAFSLPLPNGRGASFSLSLLRERAGVRALLPQ